MCVFSKITDVDVPFCYPRKVRIYTNNEINMLASFFNCIFNILFYLFHVSFELVHVRDLASMKFLAYFANPFINHVTIDD